jgi:hypothetical protein
MDAMTQSGIKPHEELDELLPFERLLTEISALFIFDIKHKGARQ